MLRNLEFKFYNVIEIFAQGIHNSTPLKREDLAPTQDQQKDFHINSKADFDT